MIDLLLNIKFDLSEITNSEVTLALVGYTVVFVALVLLYTVFKQIPTLLNFQARKQLRKEGKQKCAEAKELQIPGDELAAISMALHLHFNQEIHDEEDMILTMTRIQRRYSPWSSKIYNITNFKR